MLVQPITDEWSYGTVLHELGHFLSGTITDRVSLRREVAAWRWARSAALVWTQGAQNNMTDALSSHAAAAKQSADNILALLEVERLCCPIEYRGEIVRASS